MEEIGPMIGVIGMFVVIGYIVRWVSDNRKQLNMAKMHFDLHNKLLDKFGSSQELVEYLHSDAGSKYLKWMPTERANPYARILGSVQWGIVLLTAGVAFLFLRTQVAEAFEGFTVLGAFGVALGIGFLLSATVAFVLSKSWGVINGQQPSMPDQV
jgi:predicted transporter